jgi:hypothetical protein
MSKTAEDIQKEIEEAKKQSDIDVNRRKLMYANVEVEILTREKKLEAMKLFCNLVQKYNISNDDIVILLENVPFL